MNQARKRRHARLQFWFTIGWTVLLIPSVLWWRESIVFLVICSVWANIAGHWAAYEAAKEE